ncbi:hypothetical protein OQA88_7006 [Cercophora sp. LCS_1]
MGDSSPAGPPPPFFDTADLGGQINFYFMRKPVAWFKVDENVVENGDAATQSTVGIDVKHIKNPSNATDRQYHLTPGDMSFSSCILAERMPNSDKDAYQRELSRWYYSFSQTAMTPRQNQRTRHYINPSTRDSVFTVDYHRYGFHRDGDEFEFENLESFRTKFTKLEAGHQPEARDIPTDNPLTDNNGGRDIDTAWQSELQSIWNKAWRGTTSELMASNPEIVDRKSTRVPASIYLPDGPKTTYTFTSLASHPPDSSPGFPKRDGDFKLWRVTGNDRFITWAWLFRRACTPAELAAEQASWTGLNAGERAKRASSVEACLVPVAKIEWRSHRDFTIDPPGAPAGTAVNPGTSRAYFPARNNQGTNWEYFELLKPEVAYEYPGKQQENSYADKFPDLRTHADVRKWTYTAVWEGQGDNMERCLGVITPDKEWMNMKQEDGEYAKELKHEDNLLKKGFWPNDATQVPI